jgi:hypothetical protein
MNLPRGLAESITPFLSIALVLRVYHCQLGEIETAKRYLLKVFEIDWTGEKQRWMMTI